MDECMVERWNARVGKKDTVYHLGDVAFIKEPAVLDRLLSRLNGNKILIKGNHDRNVVTTSPRWGSVHDMLEITYKDGKDKKLIVACHYALRTWRKQGRGSFNLHGHSHNNLPPIGKQLDVGVDVHNFYPISLDYVLKYMDRQPLYSPDHHQPNSNETND
jgi:calcineurin-like phosphoesterase family protein